MGWKKFAENVKLGLLKSESVENYGAVVSIREKKPQKNEKPTKRGFFRLFNYSTPLDIILMIVGSLFAIFSGTTLPILGVFFGSMTDVFIKEAVQGLVPDFTLNNTRQDAISNAIPVDEQIDERNVTKPFANGDHIINQVIITFRKIFVANMMDADSRQNGTYHGPPLSISEFSANLNAYLVIYVIIGTFMMLCSIVQTFCWEFASEHRVFNIRKIYFKQILRQDISWFDKNENGNLPNKLSDDLERIREGTGYKCAMIVQYFSTFISGVSIGLYVNAKLTLITLCVGPFLVGLNAFCASIAARNLAQEQKRYSLAGSIVEEALTNIKTVNAFCGHAFETNRYYEKLEEGRKIAMNTFNIYSVCYALTFFLMYSAYALGFWYGSEMVEDKQTTPGNIFTVFFTVIIGAFNIGNSLPFINSVSGSIGVALSVNDVISRKVIIDPYSKTGRKPFRTFGHLQFRNVSFSYPTRPSIQVLNGLNLDIEPGKVTAIVGSSGSGKSTIVRLILRYYDPKDGEVCIDNIPLSELNVHWLRNQIGLVSQEPILFGVSIADNIKYGRDVDTSKMMEAAKQANAHNFIMKLPMGYNTLVGDSGSQLSGGQKQRIAIARALVRDPAILLLDEATSALDARSEGIVQETLTKVMKGRTTVIVAHRLSTIRNADVIYVMQNGKLFESGTHDQLMEKHSLYHNLVVAQMSSLNLTNNGKLAKHKTKSTNSISYDQEGSEQKCTSNQTQDHKHVTTFISKKNKIETDVRNLISSRNINAKKDSESNDSGGEMVEQVKDQQDWLGSIIDNRKEKNEITEWTDEYDTSELSDSIQKRRNNTSDEISEEQNRRISFTNLENIEREYTFQQVVKLQIQDWPWWIMAFVGSLCVGTIMPIFGLYYGQIFRVFTFTDVVMKNSAIFWTYMLIALAIFATVSYAVQVKGITHGCEKMIVRTRFLAFENTLKQPVGWFDLETSSPGVIANRLARNGPIIKSAAGLRAAQVLVSVVTITCAFLISVLYGWKLVLVLGIFVPVIIYSSYKQQVLLRRNQVRDTKLMDEAGRVVSEAVRNIRTVQALGREELFTEIYSKQLELPHREAKKQCTGYALLYALTQGISYYMYALSFRIGGLMVENNEMQASDVYTVFFSLSLCAACVGMAFSYLQDYSKSRTSLRLLNFLIMRKSEIDATCPNGAKPDMHGFVEFKNVHFCYPARPDVKILKGLNFTIEAGKTLALVGESGCGKSTVISLIERFYDPISGCILVDGFDIRTCNIEYLRSKLGIVTQEPVLFDITIKENIAYGAAALRKNVPFHEIQKAAKIANIHDFILSLPNRYDTVVGKCGLQLSGGQKQRVAIARALIREPKILLLDEATSALDTENEKIVQTALNKAKEGRTCIIVAHRLSTIQNADKILVLNKGKIVECGTHKELLEMRGHYYQLTQRQCL